MTNAGSSQRSYWWVNQGDTYKQQREAGILWAPKIGRAGQRVPHWDTMLEVQPGDVILHSAGGIRAVSTAATAALDARRPLDLPDDRWDPEGRLVRTVYRDGLRRIRVDEFPLDLRLAEPTGGPFKRDGGVNQGYLYRVSSEFARIFEDNFRDQFADKSDALGLYVPAEVATGAADLLRSLVGVPLTTLTGRSNRILGVQPPNVIVATDRSLDGQPVPIAWVGDALDRLRRDGRITISPAESSYRSSFIGAVLRTLPDVHVAGSPPVISFAPADTPAASDDSPFTGDLNRPYEGAQRGEQPKLRKKLLGLVTEAPCAICGESYPVRLLWAAHVKKRAVCTDDERRDLSHVAMLACTFGCDGLFEAGYLSVNENGCVIISSDATPGGPVHRRLESLAGKRVTAYTDASAKYFEWHRKNMFRGA